MKPEPLKNKKVDVPDHTDVYLEDSVVSAVTFYKRYRNNIKRLLEEQKNVWKEFIVYYDSQHDMNKSDYLEKYNIWLFDYAFSDVVRSDDIW